MLCKNIVVVTYEKDWEQCQVLLDSIDFRLTGYNVLVIDNTPEPLNLKYSMTNNMLRVIPWSDLIPNRVMHTPTYDNGWISQQLLKLQAHQLFNNEYIVLDSTSVILKSFSDWPSDLYPVLPPTNHRFYQFYKSTSKLFGFINSQKVAPPQNPVIFNCDQIKALLNFWPSWREFEEWFCSFKYPSEFWLYDLWLNRQGIPYHDTNPSSSETTLLQLYNWDSWEEYKQNPRWGYYTVATIKQQLWEDHRFDKDNISAINQR